MKTKQNLYKVNEIFLSVQAEGTNAGMSAVFVRFSGCNLNCPWCDTDHSSYRLMTAKQIDKKIRKLTKGNKDHLVVFTGGEPTLQLKEEEVIGSGYMRCCETNGILAAPSWIDWVTVSPKTGMTKEHLDYIRADEFKFVYTGKECDRLLARYEKLFYNSYLYLQPLERKGKMNIAECVKYINKHPKWTLSVQWHKLTGVR